jgi:release factor glutamine methyltransferase
MTYKKYLKEKTAAARKAHLEEEAIKLLVLELSGFDGANFVLNIDQEISSEKLKIFDEAIDKYLINHLPVQYILGYSYFYGYKMKVDSSVLIPRPETEELVGYVLAAYDDVFAGQKVKLVDVGTGSGAIAVAIAKEEANIEVSATDISKDALATAAYNAKLNGVDINFYQGDMLVPLIENNLKFDILVSNPPYICDNEYVEDIVKNNEPNIALFGGEDGMKFYDIILQNASKILNVPSIIAFEHSYSKKKEMLALANKYFPNSSAEVIQDMNKKDRIMIVINR